MNFVFEKIPLIFDIKKWLWKYNFGTFCQTIIHRRIVWKQCHLSMLILGQKACILGSTIFEIPQPNWHWHWNCSGLALKAIGILLTTSFSNNFSLFQLLQTMLAIYCFHSEFFFEKNYMYLPKKFNSETFCFL